MEDRNITGSSSEIGERKDKMKGDRLKEEVGQRPG